MRGLWLATFLLAGCFGPAGEPADGPAGQAPDMPLTWTMHDDAPSARTEVATAAIGERLYVLGGFTGGITATPAMIYYDAAIDAWATAAMYPVPIHHTATASLDGKLYAFGGYNAVPFRATSASFVYDPGSDTWSPVADLPLARGAHRAVALDDGILIAGGVGPDGGYLASTVFYDPVTDQYTPRAPMQTAREHFAMARVGDDVYAATGRVGDFSTNMASAEVYDPARDAWTPIADASIPRGGGSGDSLHGLFVVVGGEFTGGTNPEVEAYDPDTGTWRRLPDLPTPRHGLGTGVIDGRLYVVMGGPEPNLEVSAVVESLGPQER